MLDIWKVEGDKILFVKKIFAYISINLKKIVEQYNTDLRRRKAHEKAYHVCKYCFKIRKFGKFV